MFTAVVGLLLIVWVVVGIESVAAWEQALIDLAQSSPQWVTSCSGSATRSVSYM